VRLFALSYRLLSLAALVLCAGCEATRFEPANLGPHKREIRQYVDSGRYENDVRLVAEEAGNWIQNRALGKKAGETLAVVFDLDETIFRNWPQISAVDFGYVPAEWERWVQSASAPALEPVCEIYRRSLAAGIRVVFITGRPETQRQSTEENLRRIGCGRYDVLVCRPVEDATSAADYKAAERRRITASGWVIIANLGDQFSDLAGGYAERTFKLPNPFYSID
jgi:acid phosphatase